MNKYLNRYGNFDLLMYLKRGTAFIGEVYPWEDVPHLELVIATGINSELIGLYSTWLLKSLKLFWPEDRLNLTLLLDNESKEDHAIGTRLSQMWPHPKVVYRKPGDPFIYAIARERRIFLSYFYPEEYVSAEYVGFVDTDTMFITVVTPKMLFADGKPTVQARIGQSYYQVHQECSSNVTEYFIGKKDVLQCMTYFPIIFKVQHVVEFRKFAEKRHRKPFVEIFKKSFEFQNTLIPESDCCCQYTIICNYVWYYHRDEYDFHLQKASSENWMRNHSHESQQLFENVKNIEPKYFTPKPRMAINAKHYMKNNKLGTLHVNVSNSAYFTGLKQRLREGLCHSILFDRCPEKCVGIEKNSMQLSLCSFEIFDSTRESQCLEELKKHYQDVKQMIVYNEQHGIRMFGAANCSAVCNETFYFHS